MTANISPNIIRREVLHFSLCYTDANCLFAIVSDSCSTTHNKKKQYTVWLGLAAVIVGFDRIRSHPVAGHCCLMWLRCVSYSIMWFPHC